MTKATRLARAKQLSQNGGAAQALPSDDASAATLEQLAYRSARYDDLLRDIRSLATRSDGWLRFIPDTDRQQVWLKWKFTTGPWERHYLMVAIEDMRAHDGLRILLRKIYEVDNGERRPTLDKLYEQD